MAFCTNCGEKIEEWTKFCANCGHAGNNNSANQRKTVYDGEIHKCPNCGERLDSFVTSCPACGYELRGVRTASVVNELAKKLEQTDSIEQKIDLIRNFYIPNTKEDICEFFILALSNIKADNYDAEAWYAKLEQAYQKAKLSFGTTSEFQHLDQLYNKIKKEQRTKSIARNIKKSKMLQSLLLGAVGALMIIIGFFAGSMSGDSESPFYMIALIGILPLVGAFGLAGSDSAKKKNNKRND